MFTSNETNQKNGLFKLIDISELHIKWSPLLRYPFAVSIALIAILFRFLLLPVEAGLAFLTFYPAIVISFYLCGIRPGIVTVLLSAAVSFYFFEPPFIAVIIFLFSASLIGFVVRQIQGYAKQFQGMLASLQQNELSYQSFLEDQTEVICRFKADGTILYVNAAFCRWFGMQRENLIGQKWHPVIWSEDIPLINEKLDTLSPENPVVTIENRVATAGGIIRWGQFVNRAFFDKEGQLIETQAVGRDITERKLIEQAIQDESEKNEALLNAASDGVHILDKKGNIVQFSASFARMLGYTHEETAKLNVVDWEAKVPANQLIDSVIRHIKQPATFETKHRRKDGSIIDVEINAKEVEFAGKQYLYASSRDITERKLNEMALQRESEKNQMLLHNASDGIHILDSDGNVLEVSDSFCSMMGYSREELIGMNVTQLDAALDKNEVTQVFKQQFAHPARSQFERRHCRKDGSYFDVEISGFPLQLDGKPVIFNSSRDISERKRFEDALRDHEERLSLATLHNGVGIWDWNLLTQEMVWDDSMYALYRIRREDFSGTEEAWRQSLHPDDIKRGDSEVEAALSGEKPFDTEFRVCWSNGEIRYIKAVAKVFRDEQGKPIRMLGTNIDVTDRKLLQFNLERQAHIDYLTGVNNRRYFMEQAELELSRSIRYSNSLSVFMIDIDFFKNINDSHGHKVGDTVLKKLVEVCRETMREIDIVGRMGGEEFAIQLPETGGAEAVEAAERLRMAITNAKVPLESGLPIHFTVSIGVASLASKDDNMDTLLNLADKALYEAKESGRNKVCLAKQ